LLGSETGRRASVRSRRQQGARQTKVDVEIRVAIRAVDPIVGTARTESGSEVAFEGWLELLEVIAQMVDPHAQTTSGPDQDR
jgi:hypothetical protein